jgi:hypothetical protein
MKTALASLLFLLVLTSVQAIAQTKQITIGKLNYMGTNEYGSGYQVLLNTDGITQDPIPFSNAIVSIGNSSEESGPITTGPGCGIPPYQTSCDMLYLSGPNLPTCAIPSTNQGPPEYGWTQICAAIDLQLVSPTGQNFSITLVDGEQFCTHGVTNTFLLAKAGQLAVEPVCGEPGFCSLEVPIILHAAPAKSCSR